MGKVVSWQSARAEKADTLNIGGGGGIFDGMEARVVKLESNVEHLQQDVSELRGDMKNVLQRLTAIETTLATSMATKGFVVTTYLVGSAVLGAIILFQSQIQTLIGVIPKP